MPAAVKAPAKGLKKERLAGGKSAPAPPPPAKKATVAAPTPGGPVSGRRSNNPPPPTPNGRVGTATGGAKPTAGKTGAVGINPNVANALKGGATAGGKKAVGFGDLGPESEKPLGNTGTKPKPGFLSDSEDEGGNADADDDDEGGGFDGCVDSRVVALVEGVRRGWSLIKRQSQVGSPSDAELKKMDLQKKDLETQKKKMAAEIRSWGKKAAFEDPDEYLEDFADFIDRLVMESDEKPGNLELVRTCLKSFSTIDWAAQISERQWIVNSAADGSMGYMEIFLEVPNVSDTFDMDLPEIVATCCYNQTCRIPMMALLLRYDAKVIKFADQECFDDLVDYFNEYWEDIASKKKAIHREDRTGRIEVLSKLISHPAIGPILKLDGEESGDGLNIYHRAAYEGELDILQLLLVKHKVVQDVNQTLGENMTALIQATMGDHVQCVQLLLDQPGIDPKIKCPEGTALEIAKMLRKNPLLIAALEKHK